MARTGKESKGKQKKAERKAMEKKMNAGYANVKVANEQVCTISTQLGQNRLILISNTTFILNFTFFFTLKKNTTENVFPKVEV